MKKAVCTVCKNEYGSLAAHKSNNLWKTVAEATVLQTGKQTQNCSVCGTVMASQDIPKLKATLQLPGKITSFDIKKGSKSTISVTMTEGDSLISCKSSNTKLLTVSAKSNGTVKLQAKKTGKLTLTFKLESGLTKKINVKVISGAVATKKLTLETRNVTLAKGKSVKLNAVRVPFTSTQKITYTSSNKKIAKVSSSGKITAVSPGKAIITAKSGSKKITCTVTVQGIGNIKTALTLKKGKTSVLKPKLYGLTEKATFKSSNSKVAAVNSSGKITAKKKGTATITVKCGKFSVKCKVKVK